MKRKGVTATCTDVVHHIGEDLDHFLAEEMFALIRQHLDTCPNCEAYIDSMKKLVELYRRYPNPNLDDNARSRLHMNISH